MLAGFKRQLSGTEVRRFIRTDIAASVAVHLTVLALVILFTEVHPFGSVTAEPIMVDIVTPDEMTKKPEAAPQPPWSEKATTQTEASTPEPAVASPPPPAQPASTAESIQAKALPQPQSEPKSQSQSQPQPLPKPEPQSQPPARPAPAYAPPEPDLTVKYHVMLGLPEDMPVAANSADNPSDGTDARDSSAANVKSSLVAAFFKHLRTCLKLPAPVSASDDVMIKLRVAMAPDGRLAAAPMLIEGTASMKGLELKQSAISGLSACQPYDMLPANRYREWKVLDLTFTPRDFSS